MFCNLSIHYQTDQTPCQALPVKSNGPRSLIEFVRMKPDWFLITAAASDMAKLWAGPVKWKGIWASNTQIKSSPPCWSTKICKCKAFLLNPTLPEQKHQTSVWTNKRHALQDEGASLWQCWRFQNCTQQKGAVSLCRTETCNCGNSRCLPPFKDGNEVNYSRILLALLHSLLGSKE